MPMSSSGHFCLKKRRGQPVSKSKTQAGTTVPQTDEAMTTAEREAVAQLAAVMPTWYDIGGPGIDAAFYALSRYVMAADRAARPFDDGDLTSLPGRWAAVQAMNRALKADWPLSIKRQQQFRLKALRSERRDGDDGRAYERRTIEYFAADFPAWYDEVGLWGLLRSLNEFCEIVSELFVDAKSAGMGKVGESLFYAAFELRRRTGKIPSEVTEALEVLAREDAGLLAAA